MTEFPENLTNLLLREIRVKLDEHTVRFDQIEARVKRVEHRLDDLNKVVAYSLGQSTETQFRQAQSEKRSIICSIDSINC